MSFKTELYKERYSNLLSSAHLTPFPTQLPSLREESPLPFIFFNYFGNQLYFWLCCLHCWEQAFPSCSEQGLSDGCGEGDSLCGGFSRGVGPGGLGWQAQSWHKG